MARPIQPAFSMTRRQALRGLLGLGASLSLGCTTGNNFCILGYTSEPNYDPDIRTVFIPQFKSTVLETTPFRGMEFKLTREVITQLEATTPFKVISDPDGADTELQGTIVSLRKQLLNRTPFNETRDTELILGVEIVWHDLRPGREGKILTNPQPKKSALDAMAESFDPLNPAPPNKPDRPQPVFISDSGRIVHELGETSTSGLDMAIKKVAVKIVSAMERPW